MLHTFERRRISASSGVLAVAVSPRPRPSTSAALSRTATLPELSITSGSNTLNEDPRLGRFFKREHMYRVVHQVMDYRVTHLVANLGWVDLDLGCSAILLGQ